MEVTAILFSLGAVVLAEMGDKTQLLAMAFAAKYKASKVLLGVFIATIFNHAIAVAVGNLLNSLNTVQIWIQGLAALAFIFFGLWTIRGDKLEGEENVTTKYGAVITVTLAFFLAEMGDKTQLTTIALATRFSVNPLLVLVGTTLGMLIADGIGIILGVILCKKIPERKVKLISAGVFIIFGFLGCYQVMRNDLNLSSDTLVSAMTLLYVLTAAAVIYLVKKEKTKSVKGPELCPRCETKKR